VALIRSIAPNGYDLATVQSSIIEGNSEDDSIERARHFYLKSDLTHDGIQDLMVILEENPKIENYKTKEPCETLDYDKGCRLIHGQRILNIYTQSTNETYRLILSKPDFVLTADEGGVWGDPLQEAKVNKKHAFIISYYGGSSDRWQISLTVQFRQASKEIKKSDFYIVGFDSLSMNTHELDDYEKISKNYITGREIYDKVVNGKRSIKTIYNKKPLVKLTDYRSDTLFSESE